MTPEQLAAIDPSTLTGQQRAFLRAVTYSHRDPTTRAAAQRILESAKQRHPSQAYRRGAARAAGYGTGPGVDHINP